MIYYLIQYFADLSAATSYIVAKKFYKNYFYSITEMFAYCNMYILILLFFLNPFLKRKYNFNLFKITEYISNINIIYVTLLSVLSSYLKTILLSHLFNISQLTLRSYSILCPFATLLLCHIFLKDQKLNKSFLFAFVICFIGFLILNINAKLSFGFNLALIIYILLNSYSDFKLKSISFKRGLEMMLFDNLMFLFVSSIVFIIAFINEPFTMSVLGVQKFTISKLLNMSSALPLFFLALFSFLAHNFKMLSYKAKHIVGIIITGIFFKSFNSILATYIQDGVLPSLIQCFAVITMCLGLSIFMYKSYNKKR